MDPLIAKCPCGANNIDFLVQCKGAYCEMWYHQACAVTVNDDWYCESCAPNEDYIRCPCGTVKEGLSIQCEDCETWYHQVCAELDADDIPSGSWYCEKCASHAETVSASECSDINTDSDCEANIEPEAEPQTKGGPPQNKPLSKRDKPVSHF